MALDDVVGALQGGADASADVRSRSEVSAKT
jgi:hypothetical protein